MADLSKTELSKHISEVLKDADLHTTSAKKVREELQKKLKCDLTSRKKEIDMLLMEYVNAHKSESEEDEKEGSEEEKEEDEEQEEEEVEVKKPTASRKKRKAGSDDDSDDDYVSKERSAKKKKKATNTTKGTRKGKGTGFTRPYSLSPDLAAIVGADSLPRHEVVKKVWSIIKERNLYDPKNKQFAVCDSELMKVIGVKRFRIFAMLKYLKPHFVSVS